MEYDRSRVYTVMTADELKAGDKVIVADNFYSLKRAVLDGTDVFPLLGIKPEDHGYRFIVDEPDADAINVYALAYLVERKTKECRPYICCDEMVEDFEKRTGFICVNPTQHPLIWVKEKDTDVKCLLTDIRKLGVMINGELLGMGGLFDYYTYLDGTPCGIVE